MIGYVDDTLRGKFQSRLLLFILSFLVLRLWLWPGVRGAVWMLRLHLDTIITIVTDRDPREALSRRLALFSLSCCLSFMCSDHWCKFNPWRVVTVILESRILPCLAVFKIWWASAFTRNFRSHAFCYSPNSGKHQQTRWSCWLFMDKTGRVLVCWG